MKLLWVSDSPQSPSGFGAVTRAVCSRLADAGHEIEILGWQTRGGGGRWHGIPVRPVRRDLFGADALLGYLMRFNPHFVVTLADVWWMSFMADPPIQDYLDRAGARWVHYYPVDGADVDGRLPSGWVRMLETADVPIAMSRFGAEVSRACGVDCAYIPHGVELDVFAPPADKAAAKDRLGYEGRFVVLSDARNQPRKLIPRVLDVAAEVVAKRPDIVFHLHTDPDDGAAKSELYHYGLREDVRLLGLDRHVHFTAGFRMRAHRGLRTEDLAAVYAAADAHLLGSWGEGFGLPNLQAASAGLVPIAVGYSASRELVDGHGFAVAAESSVVDEFGIVRCLPSREEAADAIIALHDDPALLAERSRRSREFALDYDWDRIAGSWERVLAEAPRRRPPVRSRVFAMGGGLAPAPDDLPEPVAEAARTATAALPEGATVRFQMTERQFGAVAADIHAETFRSGDFLSIPVRLGPLFDGAPRAPVGRLLVGRPDVPFAAAIRGAFPGVAVSLPTPPDDPVDGYVLSLEELLPALPHYALVVDYSGGCPPGTDAACAALGVPYVGGGDLWPPIEGHPVAQLRLLLTDQGLSERRRLTAAARVKQALGEQVVERLRQATLVAQPQENDAGQPGPVAPPPARRSEPAAPAGLAAAGGELLLVRAVGSDALPALRAVIASHGWLELMRTGGDTLVVAVTEGGKDLLESHPLVALANGVTLDEEADGARELKGLFVDHVSRQLTGQGTGAAAPAAINREEAP